MNFFRVIIFLIFGLCQAQIPLSTVQTLTFNQGEMVNARRVAPIPQLTCIGKSPQLCQNQPTSVQCTNMGSDGIDIQWACEAELPDTIQFGKIEVVCEGYNSSHDPNILAGSCGLEFEIAQTSRSTKSSQARSTSSNTSKSTFGTLMVWLLILGMLSICISGPANTDYGHTDYRPQRYRSSSWGSGSSFLAGAAVGGALASSRRRYRGSGISNYSRTTTMRTARAYGGTRRR